MTQTEMDGDLYSWNQCPPKIIESCKTCGSHCYCDRWKGYQQGVSDSTDKFSNIKVGKTLHQIARMIVSGDIPNDVYDKFLSNTQIGFMTPMEICKTIIEEQIGEKNE